MAKRYVHNPTDQVMFIGGTMVAPGEGREVDEQFLPPDGRPRCHATGKSYRPGLPVQPRRDERCLDRCL